MQFREVVTGHAVIVYAVKLTSIWTRQCSSVRLTTLNLLVQCRKTSLVPDTSVDEIDKSSSKFTAESSGQTVWHV